MGHDYKWGHSVFVQMEKQVKDRYCVIIESPSYLTWAGIHTFRRSTFGVHAFYYCPCNVCHNEQRVSLTGVGLAGAPDSSSFHFTLRILSFLGDFNGTRPSWHKVQAQNKTDKSAASPLQVFEDKVVMVQQVSLYEDWIYIFRWNFDWLLFCGKITMLTLSAIVKILGSGSCWSGTWGHFVVW